VSYDPINENIEEVKPEYFIDPILRPNFATGLIPRNYSTHPPGYLGAQVQVYADADIIPENEWESRLKDQQQSQSDLFSLRELYYDFLKSLNQLNYGYCWAFSTVKCVMYIMARMRKHVEADILSAWMVAGIIKNYRNQGGWNQQSLKFCCDVGVATLLEWPQGARGPSARVYDTPEMRASAAKRIVTEFRDGTDSREQNKKIMVSAFLRGEAPALDYNHIGHSLAGCRLVSLNPLIVDCDNSWGETSGTKGLYRLQGRDAIPDGISVATVRMAA